jgi:hypothetical protein
MFIFKRAGNAESGDEEDPKCPIHNTTMTKVWAKNGAEEWICADCANQGSNEKKGNSDDYGTNTDFFNNWVK